MWISFSYNKYENDILSFYPYQETPTRYSFHYILDYLLLGGKTLKGLKATAHHALPSMPFCRASLAVASHCPCSRHADRSAYLQSGLQRKAPYRNRGLLHQGHFVFFLASLCVLAASTPRVRVNTSAGSIYFHCLHSVKQINLFIQTRTEKWLINAHARPCFFAFTRWKMSTHQAWPILHP